MSGQKNYERMRKVLAAHGAELRALVASHKIRDEHDVQEYLCTKGYTTKNARKFSSILHMVRYAMEVTTQQPSDNQSSVTQSLFTPSSMAPFSFAQSFDLHPFITSGSPPSVAHTNAHSPAVQSQVTSVQLVMISDFVSTTLAGVLPAELSSDAALFNAIHTGISAGIESFLTEVPGSSLSDLHGGQPNETEQLLDAQADFKIVPQVD